MLIQLYLLKVEFITDFLKEAFLRRYKPPPPMFLMKFPKCPEYLF